MLARARAFYHQDVVAEGKRYERYVEDFVNGHRYIDCDKAVCRNCHEMNICIVKGLLTECAHLVEPFFTAGSFSPEDSRELIRMYDMSESLPRTDKHRAEELINAPPFSFGCNFSREQMAGIVSCANTYHLFSVSVRSEDMEALFTCKEGFRIRVNNNRHVAVLFDALLENTLIQPYWQSVLDKGHFLLSKDGKRYVTASSLSTALSAARIHMTSISYGIRKAIKKLKE